MTGTWISFEYTGTFNPAALAYSRNGNEWWILKGNAESVYDGIFTSPEPGIVWNNNFYISKFHFPVTTITNWSQVNTGTNYLHGILGAFTGWTIHRTRTV